MYISYIQFISTSKLQTNLIRTNFIFPIIIIGKWWSLHLLWRQHRPIIPRPLISRHIFRFPPFYGLAIRPLRSFLNSGLDPIPNGSRRHDDVPYRHPRTINHNARKESAIPLATPPQQVPLHLLPIPKLRHAPRLQIRLHMEQFRMEKLQKGKRILKTLRTQNKKPSKLAP